MSQQHGNGYGVPSTMRVSRQSTNQVMAPSGVRQQSSGLSQYRPNLISKNQALGRS